MNRPVPVAIAFAACLLLFGAGRASAEPPRRREVVVLQEVSQAFGSSVPIEELRAALQSLTTGLGPSDRLAVVLFDGRTRVLQRLDDPPAQLATKLPGLEICGAD